MCAIFSAKSYDRFQYLYEKNLSRGNFAYGFAFRDKFTGRYHIERQSGVAKFGQKGLYDKYDYFLGHVQAPTSSIREFNNETSHPFRHMNTYVSHNGVLSNDKELKESLPKTEELYYNEVDSSVIPVLINYESSQTLDLTYRVILKVLEKLKGTHSTWIIDNNTKSAYFARSGSTLFMNKSTLEFSSIQLSDVNEEVPEGELFYIDYDRFKSTGTFKSNSPFFIV